MSQPATNEPESASVSTPPASSLSQPTGPTGQSCRAGSAGGLRLGSFGMGVIAFDLLICLVNLFALGWMIHKAYVVQDINYTSYSFFVNMGIAATAVVGVLGTLGNVLLMAGWRLGARFAWYRIALGVASIGIALVLMFMMLPNTENLMSERNQSTYIGFIGSSLLYAVWLIVYTIVAAKAHWKRS